MLLGNVALPGSTVANPLPRLRIACPPASRFRHHCLILLTSDSDSVFMQCISETATFHETARPIFRSLKLKFNYLIKSRTKSCRLRPLGCCIQKDANAMWINRIIRGIGFNCIVNFTTPAVCRVNECG